MARKVFARLVDITTSLIGLVVTLPVIGAAAAASALAHGGSPLLRQERAGLAGRPITVHKLRTMTDARDSAGELLPDSARITKVGQLLRRVSIDELPQLWTILRGDMSLVGPRPLPVAYVNRYSAEQRRRLDVKPGLTGWAQVNGRNAISWSERLALDVWYVDHVGVVLDLRILLMTVRAVVRSGGISAEGHATMPEFLGDEPVVKRPAP